MADSILTSTKKILGLTEDYEAFDLDIVTHINSVFFTLNQLGIGPAEGFMIEDASATWDDYLGANLARFVAVRSYVFLKVRLLFDPPTTSYVLDALKSQAAEMEWRLNSERERTDYVDPLAVDDLREDEGLILDGGSA